jgi:hypothetical protein
VHKLLESVAPDVLRVILTEAVTKLMAVEVDALCGAGYDERSAERVNATTTLTSSDAGVTGRRCATNHRARGAATRHFRRPPGP